MTAWLEILLTNALVAFALGGVALAAARLRARPALVHGLWLLAVLKLVTPPLFRIPIAVLPGAPGALGAPIEPIEPGAPSPLSVVDAAGASIPSSTSDASSVPGAWRAPRAPGAAPFDAHRAAPGGPPAFERSGSRVEPRRAATAAAPGQPIDWAALLLDAWLLGAAASLGLALARIARFAAVVRAAEGAPPAWQREAARLGARLGLRAIPDVRFVSGRVAPLLWAVGRRKTLVFPTELAARLDRPQRLTLLAHELAHLRRRDHWVRWLELCARVAHWWNPLALWACRELREAEERCCDAWVVWALPDAPRDYADALLSTVEFLSDAPPLPVVASGVGRVRHLKWRLTMIMRERHTTSLSRHGKLAVLAAALCLPVLPAFGQDVEKRETQEHHKALGRSVAEIESLQEEIDALEQRMHRLLERGDADAARSVGERIARVRQEYEAMRALRENLRAAIAREKPDELGGPDRADLPPERSHGEPGHDHATVLRALAQGIHALRERDCNEEADVLAALLVRHEDELARHPDPRAAGRSGAFDAERALLEAARASAQGGRMLDLQKHLEQLREQRAHLERAAADVHDRMARARDREDPDPDAVGELESHLRSLHTERRDLDEHARMLERELGEHRLQRDDDNDDRFRRLEERVDELAELVRQLTRSIERDRGRRGGAR